MDPRFVSPSAALFSYWEALRAEDPEALRECFADPGEARPLRGMLWFLPPSRDLALTSIRLLPVTSGRVVAMYDVEFRPVGGSPEMGFTTGTELVRARRGWRIARIAGHPGLPEWRPIPHRVDI